jgi:hypothetical protein
MAFKAFDISATPSRFGLEADLPGSSRRVAVSTALIFLLLIQTDIRQMPV